jgi:hypothetical protein
MGQEIHHWKTYRIQITLWVKMISRCNLTNTVFDENIHRGKYVPSNAHILTPFSENWQQGRVQITKLG